MNSIHISYVSLPFVVCLFVWLFVASLQSVNTITTNFLQVMDDVASFIYPCHGPNAKSIYMGSNLISEQFQLMNVKCSFPDCEENLGRIPWSMGNSSLHHVISITQGCSIQIYLDMMRCSKHVVSLFDLFCVCISIYLLLLTLCVFLCVVFDSIPIRFPYFIDL